MARKLNAVAPMRGGRNNAPKDAPGPKIPRQKLNKHGTAPGQKLHPELHSQQLNPISKKPGMPQYKDETPIEGKHLRAMIAHLRNS